MSSPPVLSRSTFTMGFVWLADEFAVYSYESPDVIQFLRVAEREWEDMGRPETITVTIQPGDLLNG